MKANKRSCVALAAQALDKFSMALFCGLTLHYHKTDHSKFAENGGVCLEKSMLSVEERGKIYKQQLSDIQNSLLKMFRVYEWETLDRGRKPNAGVFGKIGEYQASVQVESMEVDWSLLPDEINSDMKFTIWCGVYSNSRKIEELLQETNFKCLAEDLDRFLYRAYEILNKYEQK